MAIKLQHNSCHFSLHQSHYRILARNPHLGRHAVKRGPRKYGLTAQSSRLLAVGMKFTINSVHVWEKPDLRYFPELRPVCCIHFGADPFETFTDLRAMNSQRGAQYLKIDLYPIGRKNCDSASVNNKHDQHKMRGLASVMEKICDFPSSGSVAMQLQSYINVSFRSVSIIPADPLHFIPALPA